MVEESRAEGHVHGPINATFIALIPKSDSSTSYDDFQPISLYNCLYKIISKVIAKRIKEILSRKISREKFGFLEGRQIHEAIGIAQEGLHSLKTKTLKGVVIKLDLLKAYDRVNWLYIRMLLTHLGLSYGFIRWVMSCLTTISFVVLVNGAASPFFHSERGLRQGCPLSPLLFHLVAEGLSRFLDRTKRSGGFNGLQISQVLSISHLLFVDDILIFCDGSRHDVGKLCQGLALYKTSSRMQINEQK